jgi:nicotinate-nucleotide adenylyltransferase
VNVKGRIGLFGGSFDPIHMGHMILAQTAVNFVGLERVFFIPTAIPPHKRRSDLTSFEIRREMVELAIEDNPLFELSLLEGKGKISYTYESVLHFKGQGYGREQIHLLIGSDSLDEICTWKNPGVIFSNSTIVAMQRPGSQALPALPREAAVIVITTGSNTISSSEIREFVKAGRSIRYLVPRRVELFVADHSLYRNKT